MFNKARGLVFTIITAFLLVSVAQAQNATRSVYSRFGLGDMQFQNFSQYRAMGYTGTAMRSANTFAPSNPASYSAVTYTTLEAGGFISFGDMETSNSLRQRYYTSSFNNLALAFPILKNERWGMSFGLLPYSNTGYSISQVVDSSFATYQNLYGSRGGLSKVYWGNGFRVFKGLSVGFNTSYIFGQTDYEKRVVFPDSTEYENTVLDKQDFLHGFNITAGLQYQWKHDTSGKYISTFGASVDFNSSFKVNQSLALFSEYNTYPYTLHDTVEFYNRYVGRVAVPMTYQLGYTFENINHWLVTANFSQTNWKDFSYLGDQQNLQNSRTYGIGGYWAPDFESRNYLFKTQYRLGYRYTQGDIKINNTRIDEQALSVGFGVPLRNNRARINLTGEYIRRGTTANNLIMEENYRISIGITFNEMWFLKRKYD